MKSSKSVKRFLKREYGPRKIPLPKSLEFLSSVNFHAVVEDESSGRIIRTVEIKPTTLKRLSQDMELLYSYLGDSDDLIKKLRADNRQLRSDNKKLAENHDHSSRLELALNESQHRIDDLSSQLKPSELLKSENSELQAEITNLRRKLETDKLELARLEEERRDLLAVEKENMTLRDKMERLERANKKLMENTNSGVEPNRRRERNSFFSNDKIFKITSNKPYGGGKPS